MHRMSEPANKGFNKTVNCTSCAISIYLLFMNKTSRKVLPEINKQERSGPSRIKLSAQMIKSCWKYYENVFPVWERFGSYRLSNHFTSVLWRSDKLMVAPSIMFMEANIVRARWQTKSAQAFLRYDLLASTWRRKLLSTSKLDPLKI